MPSHPLAVKASARHATLVATTAGVAGLLLTLMIGCTTDPAGTDEVQIIDDPVLRLGQSVYRERCASCHGLKGKGDGPMSKGLSGPPPGDLTDNEWKHGSHPEEVIAIIRQGAPGASMPGFGKAISDKQVVAVTAYVYHLAGRDVPPELISE